ncbi:MAG: SH3 domain-containing protein [Synechococcus sp.]|nr:SH3 domain-containing protein [Synechococcus sp.]
MNNWLKFSLASAGLSLPFLGASSGDTAVPVQPEAPEAIQASDAPPALVAQTCPYSWQPQPQRYAKVITQSTNLRIRSTPGGRVIGSIPKGWNVVVLGKSANGAWTRITSHFGAPSYYTFYSAPDFREGWVSSQYLQDLGSFCDKPMAAITTSLSAAAHGSEYAVQEDWLAIADRIGSD